METSLNRVIHTHLHTSTHTPRHTSIHIHLSCVFKSVRTRAFIHFIRSIFSVFLYGTGDIFANRRFPEQYIQWCSSLLCMHVPMCLFAFMSIGIHYIYEYILNVLGEETVWLNYSLSATSISQRSHPMQTHTHINTQVQTLWLIVLWGECERLVITVLQERRKYCNILTQWMVSMSDSPKWAASAYFFQKLSGFCLFVCVRQGEKMKALISLQLCSFLSLSTV